MNQRQENEAIKPRSMFVDRIFLLVYGLTFAVSTFRKSIDVFQATASDPSSNPFADYMLTEWMVSYSAGFVRRGLPGSLLIKWVESSHINLALVVGVISITVFLLLTWLTLKVAKGRVPAWLPLATPLLAYPLYTADQFTRKDTLLILMLLICLALIKKGARQPALLLAWPPLCAATILVHELFFFVAYPLSFMLSVLVWRRHRQQAASSAALTSNNRLILVRLLLITVVFSLPLIAILAALLHHGTAAQALHIENSWRAAFGFDQVSTITPQTAIWWLGSTSEFSRLIVWSFLTNARYGFPYWMFALFMLVVAISSLSCLWYAKNDRKFFIAVCSFQILIMTPLIFYVLDTGRLVFMILISAFLATCHFGDCVVLGGGFRLPFPRFSPGSSIAPAAVLLAFWGLPITGWGWDRSWFPGSLVTRALIHLQDAYIALRLAGMPSPRALF